MLDGKLGTDILFGFGGADTFRFSTAPSIGNVDVVKDMVAGLDEIELDNAIFTGLAADGPLAAGAFVNGTTALDGDDRILYNSANGYLYYDSDGLGGTAAVLFAVIENHAAITFNDFTVI